MSDLGDLLELLHGARRSYATARAAIRLWRDEALERQARQRAIEASRGAMSVWTGGEKGSGDPVARGEWEQVSRLWLSWPSKARWEAELEWKGKQERGVSLIDGKRWWRDWPDVGFSFSEDDSRVLIGIPHIELLDPWLLVSDLDLEVCGSGAYLGREAIEARASVREERVPYRSRVMSGADEFELAVDLERGVLLRLAALLEGVAFEIKELTELVFDEDLDPELFHLQPPPERERRPRRRGPRSACNFCGKSGEEVEHLVVGHPVYICNECSSFAREITSSVPPRD